MVGRDNVTFRFDIDGKQFIIKGKQMGAVLVDIQRSAVGAGRELTRTGNSAAGAGKNMAASAVNFQTATQGMLNLSTAAVQTYTSISNLDRAHNRAKMSVIAVARAEDLLNNKIQRRNDMEAQGITSGGKYANMQREIATATADLTVKQEKQTIEQAAVNDIYMLFASNIANVVISSMQTIGVLLGHERSARLGVAAATKLQSVVLSRQVTVTVASAAATGGHLLVTKAITFALIRQTAATHGLTAATKLFMRAAWPLLAVSAAITAAYLIYENNVLGAKDGIDKLMGTEKSHLDVMQEERDSVDGLTQSYDGLTNSIKKLSPIHEQYLKMMRDAAANRGDARLAASYQAQLQQPVRQGNFSSGVGSPSFSGSGGVSSGGVSSGSPITQGALIQQQAQINDINTRRESRGMSPVTYSAPVNTDSPDPFGSILQQEMFKLLTPPEQMETMMQLSISEGLKGRTGSQEKYMQKAESMRYAAESWRPRGIETDPVKAFKAVESKNNSGLKSNNLNKRFFPAGASKSISFGGDVGDGSGLAFYLQGRDKFDRNMGREIFFAGTGGEDIAKWIKQGGNFGRNKYGGGNPILDLLSARQTDKLRNTPGAFEKTRSNLGIQTQRQFDAMNREYNISSGGRGVVDSSLGAGGESATARYQGGSVALNQGARDMISAARRGDAFRNGAGGIIANISTALTGGKIFRSYRYRAGTGSDRAHKKYAGAKSIVQKAISMGIKSNPEWADRIAEIPTIDHKAKDGIAQAEFAALAAESLATQYVASINSQMTSIGFTTAMTSASNTAGFSGIGMYENIALLSATRRTNFSNTEIIGESRNKLNLTNSQVNAIRFNSTRGDIELQDRLRYVDQLDAMSSGTSPL